MNIAHVNVSRKLILFAIVKYISTMLFLVGDIVSSVKSNAPKAKDIKIRVNAKNKPSKDVSKKKTKELSEFLSKTWHVPINPE